MGEEREGIRSENRTGDLEEKVRVGGCFTEGEGTESKSGENRKGRGKWKYEGATDLVDKV